MDENIPPEEARKQGRGSPQNHSSDEESDTLTAAARPKGNEKQPKNQAKSSKFSFFEWLDWILALITKNKYHHRLWILGYCEFF